MRPCLLFFCILLLVVSCSPVSTSKLNKSFREIEEKFSDHTGFALYDLTERKTIYDYNSSQYFTPASNTKIFTFYTCLRILGDSIPALRYKSRGDSLIVWGTGDPSFLYRKSFSNSRVSDFLKEHNKPIYFSVSNFQSEHFGPGWAWDDYYYEYSSERSSLPMYGNTFQVTQKENGYLTVTPHVFKQYLWLNDTTSGKTSFIRYTGDNRVNFFPGKSTAKTTKTIPFHCDPSLIAELLSDTVGISVYNTNYSDLSNSHLLYSVPSDSLYRTMMVESDNFIAEQLLLMCSGILSDTLKPEIAIRYMMENHLNDLPDKPVWVDGSGLSRYNLFTPRSIVKLWEKIYGIVPQQRLFELIPQGGRTGTIKNYFKSESPYIYAKTGTLSNNHSLSGYMVTRKGKILIFSFMNNNYTVPVAEVRKEMERILNLIRDNY